MLRREPRIRAAVLALCTSLAVMACQGARPLEGGAAGWNVLLVSVDTLRADHLNSYGYATRTTTPGIDALLARGARFEDAMAPRAITWPSLATVLTGLYPSGHGLIGNGYEFRDGFPTLPAILQAHGYETGAFLSNMCRANHQGLDTRYCARRRGRSHDEELAAPLLDWVDRRDARRPFFAWIHYMGGHSPYLNGGDLAQELDPGYEGPVRPRRPSLDPLMIGGVPLSEPDVRHLKAIYDAAVIRTDERIAALLQELADRGAMERTVVIFLADHGEDLYDHHGYFYHTCSVYRTGLHVPLGIVAPGLIAEGVTIPGPVELADVLPTLLDLLGLPSPSELHGRSLLPLIVEPERSLRARPTFSEFDDTRIRTVYDGTWTLIHNPDEHTPLCFPGAPVDLYPIAEVELYDLASDPGEQHNLAADRPQEVERLVDLIESRFERLPGGGPPVTQELPDRVRRELEALGYVAN